MPKTKAAIYARISDPGIEKDPVKLLAKKRQDTDNQLFPLRESVASREWEVYKEYVEEMSAVKKRPKFDEMMQDAFAGKFQVIVVMKMDRFARSVKDFVDFLGKLESCNVRFIAISQGIDTKESNAASRLLVNMLAAIAEFERSIISERVKEGLARKKREGWKPGPEFKPFDAAIADEMLKAGKSLSQVAEHMEVGKSTVFDRVKAYREGEAKRKSVTN